MVFQDFMHKYNQEYSKIADYFVTHYTDFIYKPVRDIAQMTG